MTAGRNNSECFSKNWCTPEVYCNAIKNFFNGKIELDPCSNSYSLVDSETNYSFPDSNGLKLSWNYKTIFVNPPYGRDRERGTSIKDWLKRIHDTFYIYHSEILALIPVATNTSHWKKYVFGSAIAISFLYDTRLKFLIDGKDIEKGAPMSCAMIYWGSNYDRFENIFINFGAVVDIRNLYGKKIGTYFDRI